MISVAARRTAILRERASAAAAVAGCRHWSPSHDHR